MSGHIIIGKQGAGTHELDLSYMGEEWFFAVSYTLEHKKVRGLLTLFIVFQAQGSLIKVNNITGFPNVTMKFHIYFVLVPHCTFFTDKS